MMKMLELPFEINLFIYVCFASLVLGVITLLFFILNRTLGAGRGSGRKKPYGSSSIQSFFSLVFIILWILVSAAVLFLASFIQSYQMFTKKELTAVVRCTPSETEINSMSMELRIVKDGELGETESFIIKGDQWAIEGDILKWDDFVNFLGLHTMYKLTRVRGRFVDVRNEIERAPTVYILGNEQETANWRWLYKYGHKMPFVTAVYGNSVFTYPSREETYEIYVTTSGFMVQAMEKE